MLNILYFTLPNINFVNKINFDINNDKFIIIINDNLYFFSYKFTLKNIQKNTAAIKINKSIDFKNERLSYMLFHYCKNKEMVKLVGLNSMNNTELINIYETKNKYSINYSDNFFVNEKFSDTKLKNNLIMSIKINTNKNAEFKLLNKKKVNLYKYNKLIYDVKNDKILIEFIKDSIKKYVDSNIDIIDYQRIINNSNSNKLKFIKSNVYERIIEDHAFKNNALLSPCQSRFNFLPLRSSNIKSYIDNDLNYGLEFRSTCVDNKNLYTPYHGLFTNLITKKYNEIYNIKILKFKTNYFIPPSFTERNYLALLNGNFTHHGVGIGGGLRGYPELLDKNPDVTLKYNILIFYKNNVDININHKKKFYNKGDYICNISNSIGYVLLVTNRIIKLSHKTKHDKKIDECRIVGFLQ